ncbi:MAG: enoyl-CoA hydratase [Acidimicrobiia bacterium]
MDTGCEQLRAEVDDDGIGLIVFDNPSKHNAMTGEMLGALGRVRAAFAADPAVRVVVVRGAGDRAFVSGADIAQLGAGQIPAPSPTGGTPEPTGEPVLEKPSIAMIHGYCLGGGVMIALSADIRLCSDDAQFGIPAARLGVGYPHAATSTLVALVGPGQASEILFTGRRIDAAEAARIGLVNRVVAKDALEAEALTMAREIARNAPLSHVAHQRSIRAAVSGRDDDQPGVDVAIRAAWASDDFTEGAAAFLERRDPHFHGR